MRIVDNGQGFKIANAAAQYTPDIAFIHLGTNDINSGANASNNYSPVISNASKIIDSLRAANPNVRVLLSQIIQIYPVSRSNFAKVYGEVSGYNAALANLAASKTTANSPITIINRPDHVRALGVLFIALRRRREKLL